MQHIIIHKSVYLLLCVVNLVFFDTLSSGFSIYHGFIVLVVLVSLVNIGRGRAGTKTYYVEMVHSWLRILMAVLLLFFWVFLLLQVFI
jgi:hypothetical protein